MTHDTIGIDISKRHFDAHRRTTGSHARFDNTAAGFKAFSHWIGVDHPDLVVLEPTGPYHRDFEAAFAGRLPLVKVNPLQARRFAQSQGTRAKTDAVDARLRDAGKPHKLALTVLMRKLIQLANTLIREDRTWNPKPA